MNPTSQQGGQNAELDELLAANRFPGRPLLRVGEISAALGCSLQHVLDMVDEGTLLAIDFAGRNNKTARRCLRIPAASYDNLIRRRIAC